ncbi:hypothetical protein SAE02_61550 [Skermanella aerolata]|uniref:ATP-dependent Clp protease proteolytic subunit n=1 Tax=Skermanella aerolata TaxID=393310 RepID=A0A512DZU4_9PROT|nr:hypothetical protein [Skermanella aerolata]KJB91886.1 hypothetical protein N826_25555 [Skermanella aerolata KACC 11604]GEO42007.1 hypothetical protein SAE02_61550 [Skermanella aerolata]
MTAALRIRRHFFRPGPEKPALAAALLAFLLGVAPWAGPAWADYEKLCLVGSAEGGRLVLSLHDRVAPETVESVIREIRQAALEGRDLTLSLDSGGGDILAALFLESELRAASGRIRIETLVPAGGRCMSSCLIVLSAGTERVAAPDARLMAHAARSKILMPDGRTVKGLAIPAFDAAMETSIGRADPAFAAWLRDTGVLAGDDTEYRATAAEFDRAFPAFLDLSTDRPAD